MDIIMNGSETLSIQKILKQYGLKPHKGLGQNFLSDDGILEKIIDAAEISADAAVLEIGPGLGSLTRHLARRAEKVVAVELDKDLILPLQELLSPFPNITLIQGDILDFQPADAFQERYSVIANIPYYITSAVIRHLLESAIKPEKMVLTVQKEVAERICARPGKLSLLALSVQIYGETDMPLMIPATSFFPEPNVDSAVVRIRLYKEPRIEPDRISKFFRLVKAGFGQKRKTLRNSISANFPLGITDVTEKLQKAGIDPMRRAETLIIEEWNSLLNEFIS